MAKAKKEEIVEEVVEETTSETVESPTPSKGKKSSTVVRYRNRVGETVERAYSKEVHGDDFDSLASEFAEKHNGTIV